MKFFKMEKWGKISFSIAVICSIFSIIIVAYVVKSSKESWNYRINETECDKNEGTIQEVQSGKKIQNGKVLKFIKIQNGDNICILRKDGEWDEYPSISQKALKSIRKGEKIRYLKDQKNEINNYNLAYELQINKKIYIPIKQMKKFLSGIQRTPNRQRICRPRIHPKKEIPRQTRPHRRTKMGQNSQGSNRPDQEQTIL